MEANNSWAPHGKALLAYVNGKKDTVISILMNDGSITDMPIEIYFRTEGELPEIEIIALKFCKGKTLDVGAGAGAHSLILQNRTLEVIAIDVSEEAVKIMRERGVKNARQSDFLSYRTNNLFDTLLFLMNGIGIAETLEGLEDYLTHAHTLTHASSQIILDSSDLRAGSLELDFDANYFGEIDYRLSYNGKEGSPYKWLYVDESMLEKIALKTGWLCHIIYEQEDGGYLARLTKKDV